MPLVFKIQNPLYTIKSVCHVWILFHTNQLHVDLYRTSSSDGNDSQKQQHQQRPQNGSQCPPPPPHLQSQQLPQPASLYGLQQRHNQQQQHHHHQQRRPVYSPAPVSASAAAGQPGSRQPINVVAQQARQQPVSHGMCTFTGRISEYTPETAYRVDICPRANLPFIWNYPINNTVFDHIYPVGPWMYLPYIRSVVYLEFESSHFR